MSTRSFFRHERVLTIGEVAALTRAELRRCADPGRPITGVTALDRAGPGDLVFLDNAKYSDLAKATSAGACLVSERLAAVIPDKVSLLVVSEPYAAFVDVARTLFPDALRASSLCETRGVAPGAFVHPTARVESGVTIDPGCVIGPRAEIGSRTVIGAGATIGADVRIGRDCSIGANVCIVHTIIGDRVIVHPGCSFGQDGFGYVMGAQGHRKIPQIGRVIIQDDVEIGACTCIDRGGFRDTVIGEGTKIDNQVQIGHNVVIGRHCVLVAQVGIAGSVTIEDFVVLGAKVGVKDHVTIGEGSQIAAIANIGGNVPPGSRWGGTPAKPMKQWWREISILERMAKDAEERTRGGKDS
jgi:UDP-3-O-[3-hydroxymyristoyl] glucosamine N-acyltransferase